VAVDIKRDIYEYDEATRCWHWHCFRVCAQRAANVVEIGLQTVALYQ